jgi:uncharacterized protein (TIGR03437 family)
MKPVSARTSKLRAMMACPFLTAWAAPFIALLMPGVCAAQPSVIFGNFAYESDLPEIAVTGGSAAAQFTPAVDYLATVVKVPASGNQGENCPSCPITMGGAFSVAIFSDAAGVPGAPVSQNVAVTAPFTFPTVSFAPVALHGGTPYWLVLTPAGTSTGISWEVGGVPTPPFAITQSAAGTGGWYSYSGSIGPIGSNVQFEVDGTSPADNSPAPMITSLSPASAPLEVTFTLTVNGFGFVQCAATPCLGVDLADTFIPGQANAAGTQLTAIIPGAPGHGQGTFALSVLSAWGASRVSGAISNSVPFTITPAPPFTVALSTAGQLGPFAAQSIVSAYGANVATGTASASSLPLPTSLDGTTVTVTDNAGVARIAPLFYVSPLQINFEIPEGTAMGTASVSIQSQGGAAQTVTIQIGNVSPGLFELDSSGLVAAWVLPVNSGIQQPLQPVYQIASEAVVPLPINLGPSTDQIYLEMYGTGIRNANNVTASVGGLSVPVLYAGPAPDFAGEDQVNIGPLPQALAGAGSVNIVLTADGQAANTVNVITSQ